MLCYLRVTADEAVTAETSATAEAAVVEQKRVSITTQPPQVGSIEPVVAVLDDDDFEEDVEELDDTEEVAEELHRGLTLSAEGRLELCQLSKLLQCVRSSDVRMIDKLALKGVPRLLDYAHPTDNETVLGLAASRNDDTLLEHLFQLGADPNVADITGRTAAMKACQYGHLQAMKILAKAGIDMELVDDDGQGQHS